MVAPDRPATMGTAARPGKFRDADSVDAAEARQQAAYDALPDFAKVRAKLG